MNIKNIFFLVCMTLTLAPLHAQYCDIGNITLQSDADIDSFISANPNCDKFEGQIILEGQAISSIAPLSFITEIKGSLSIRNTSLTSINTFNNLVAIDTLTIIDNTLLERLDDFNTVDSNRVVTIEKNQALRYISTLNKMKTSGDGTFFLFDNQALDTLSFYKKLELKKGKIWIAYNTKLNHIDDLEELMEMDNFQLTSSLDLVKLPRFPKLKYAKTIDIGVLGIQNFDGFNELEWTENLYIYSCQSLIDFSGFDKLWNINRFLQLNSATNSAKRINGFNNLQRIGNDFLLESTSIEILDGFERLVTVKKFRIRNNTKLKTISAFDSLVIVRDSMVIGYNRMLEEISGFSRLTYPDRIYLRSNDALTDIQCFDAVDTLFLKDLELIDNINLEVCNAKGICEYLNITDKPSIIYNNAPGCNTRQEVLESCIVSSVKITNNLNNPKVYPNPVQTNLYITTDSNKNATCTMYNTSGKIVYKGTANVIDMSTMPSGLYFLVSHMDGDTYVNKVIKE